MPCDERYRSWAMEQTRDEPPAPDLLPARLLRVSLCPAAAGCRELHFEVAGMPWSWCFPAAEAPGPPPGLPEKAVLVLRPGPHGLIGEACTAHAADRSGTRARLDLATAAALALSAPVFVHRSLISLPSVVTAS